MTAEKIADKLEQKKEDLRKKGDKANINILLDKELPKKDKLYWTVYNILNNRLNNRLKKLILPDNLDI